MPHTRSRYLRAGLEKALGLSPIIGILGHRQVGKTTLVQQLVRHYCTCDNSETLDFARRDPRAFLGAQNPRPAGIDECQLAPRLFPALKEFVRTLRKPGQFLLTGSVRFTSRKAISESLTGRILNFELLPFTVPELRGESLAGRGLGLLGVDDFVRFERSGQHSDSRRRKALTKDLNRYFETGGLPGVCFLREASFRKRKLQDQIFTLLDRDLRLVYPTTLAFPQLLSFVQALAAHEGDAPQYSRIYRDTGISPPTQRKLIAALESIFMIRLLPIRGGAGYAVVFEDQAESLYLSGRSADTKDADQRSYLLYRHLRSESAYRLDQPVEFFQYRPRGGSFVPIAIREGARNLGFIPIQKETPSRSELGSAQSFVRNLAGSKCVFFHANPGLAPRALNERMWVTSLEDLV